MGCSGTKYATKTREGPPAAVTRSLSAEEQPRVTEEDEAAERAKVKAQQGRARRAGVAAESVDASKIKDYVKPVHPKEDARKQWLLNTIKTNEKVQVLFGHLEGERINDVVDACYTQEIAAGDDIIVQGGEGDKLYIVEEGSVDVFVKRPGVDTSEPRGPKVVTLGSGALFGELALLYNAPRAATVVAASNVKAFVLNAIDFKMLQVQSSQAQYAQYEGWLKEVDILKTLNHYELSRLADILESASFKGSEEIVKQGEAGDKFYILEDGTAAAFISGDDGEKQVLKYESKGSYFGEIALLTEAPRKATVRAGASGCNVVSVSKDDFSAVLGPIADILKKHADQYPQYADFLG